MATASNIAGLGPWFHNLHLPDWAADDLVLFMGVFCHLRYPLLGLDIVARKVRRMMVSQSLTSADEEVAPAAPEMGLEDRAHFDRPGWPQLAFIEGSLCGDPTNWWVPNQAAIMALLRAAGLHVTGRPGHEIYLCAPDRTRDSCASLDPDEVGAAARAVIRHEGNGQTCEGTPPHE